MSATLNITDLHELYSSVTPEEAIAIANLGAQCWLTCKQGLYDQWSASMSEEDTQKALAWKQEGRLAAIESLKSQLVEAEEAMMRAVKAEGQLSALKAAMEDEMTQRVEKALESRMKDLEIEKLREMAEKQKELGELQQRLAAFSYHGQMTQMVQDTNELLKSNLASLDAKMAEKDAELQMLAEAQKPKSSHAIGKQGEASIQELLEGPVMDAFPYSFVKNMSGVFHAADFHIFIMTESGTRKKILIDSKKYIHPVNSKEVAKLNSDVDGDEGADGGILISIDSPICKRKQFQIVRTAKKKPVLYLTFLGLDSDQQKELLCWAIEALIHIAGETDMKERDSMLDNLDRFLEEVNTSVKEMDKAIACQSKAIDAMRQVRNELLKKLVTFKKSSDPSESITQTEKSEREAGDVFIVEDTGSVEKSTQQSTGRCSVIFRSSGLQCNKSVMEGCTKCKSHMGGRKAKK
jgi:hypothetical protein